MLPSAPFSRKSHLAALSKVYMYSEDVLEAFLTEKVVPVLNSDGQSSRRRFEQAWKRSGLKCIVNKYGNRSLVSF